MAPIEQFLDRLRCPVCSGPLSIADGAVGCTEGHTSDLARQGYVSLLGPKGTTHTADSPAMLEARSRILGAGLFEPLSVALDAMVTEAVTEEVPGVVVDLGTGTGYHLERVLEVLPDRLGLGLDNSKHAARWAARLHPRAGAIVADVWAPLPLADDSAAVVLDLFAPRNGPEIARILAPGGVAIVVTPREGHLDGVPGEFGLLTVDPDKRERLARTMEGMVAAEPVAVSWEMELFPHEVLDLVAMGPGSGRVTGERLEEAAGLLPDRLPVAGRVELTCFTVAQADSS